jgi:cobyrinic acid a,c-diamide synthase
VSPARATPNSCAAACRPAWAGSAPCRSGDSLPERHLGLLQAAEIADLGERLDRLADALAASASVDLPPPVSFAEAAAPEIPPLLAGKTIAIARDAAYGFIYPANLETLHQLGAELASSRRSLATTCRLAMPSGYPAAIRNCMRKPSVPTQRCGRHFMPTSTPANPCSPNAAA